NEVPFMKSLAAHLSALRWPSRTTKLGYSHFPGRADMVTSSPDASFVVTTEAKYFVLNYPSRLCRGDRWDGNLARQHLGIWPGKRPLPKAQSGPFRRGGGVCSVSGLSRFAELAPDGERRPWTSSCAQGIDPPIGRRGDRTTRMAHDGDGPEHRASHPSGLPRP